MTALFVFYVNSQSSSEAFYRQVLDSEPRMSVPGMTEFELSDGVSLGLMPSAGIRSLLGDKLPDPESAAGIPRAELYLHVPDAGACHQRALDAGAVELSPLLERGWGDRAAYCLDLDGHVLVFAEPVLES